MSIPASAVGAQFNTRTITVAPRMALAYAAGIGCTRECYFDDARPHGLIVPPPFCVSLEWLLAGDTQALARMGIAPDDQLRAVHAGQDTQFHRPLLAGETVSVSGRIASIQPTRAGACVTSQFTVAGADGDPITTSRCEAIYRGVETDADRQAGGSSGLDSGQAPQRHEERTEIRISREFPHVYSACASIWNPIHTERRIALAAGLPDIIVHGTALWALVWKQLSAIHGDLSSLSGRFTAMAIPGKPVVLRTGQLEPSNRSLGFRLDNDRGQPVISAGWASFPAK